MIDRNLYTLSCRTSRRESPCLVHFRPPERRFLIIVIVPILTPKPRVAATVLAWGRYGPRASSPAARRSCNPRQALLLLSAGQAHSDSFSHRATKVIDMVGQA